MICFQLFASPARAVFLTAVVLVCGLGVAAATELPDLASSGTAARIVSADVQDGRSRLTLSVPVREDKFSSRKNDDTRSLLVAVPRGTTTYSLTLAGPAGATVTAPEGLMIMRGQPVLRVRTTGTNGQPVELTITHDGRWSRPGAHDRLAAASTRAALGRSLPVSAANTGHVGSYLIIHAPALAAAVTPLVDWKTRKGYNVRVASTNDTGVSTAGILAYIQNAYDTWDLPPEYVLLVGDVDEIPTFSFYGNPSDQPYVMLDGDDWLMDAMIGRLPVGNENEARTLVQKSINYERFPDMADDESWQTRSLMVAGVYASDTPGHTVAFCGERLQAMGFPVPTSVTSPPLPSLQGAQVVRSTINAGVGLVVYRGWAYGTAGWDPPTFTVDDIPALDTNAMTPIVMSFVCLNGDYTATSPCFGEVFVRQGSPAEPGKGAVAFIGNGEHWSHTRYNDAMAISVFERIVDPDVTDLGTLLNSGKFRFMDYFPNELSAAEYGEESVEFYFHIYNLMGDPSLKFWRESPREINVSHVSNLPAGSTRLAVAVVTATAGPVAGARVGVVQDGTLIGSGVTDANGNVDLHLSSVSGESGIAVTVSEAGCKPYEGIISTGTAATFLAVTTVDVDDSAGNNDQLVNPGETLALTATMRNHGSSNSGAYDLSIASIGGPATAGGDQAIGGDLAAGSEGVAAGSLGLVVSPDAADGADITVQLDAARSGGLHDYSDAHLIVAAPAWEVVSLAATDGSAPRAGQTTDLALTLRNTGSVAAGGGSVDLSLLTVDAATLGTSRTTLPACQPGETVTTAAAFDLDVDADTATATNLTFALVISTTAGYRTETNCATMVGPVDISSPVGPDRYGYFAYDSADYDYPASRPVYAWREISTALGGHGTALDFPLENGVVWMVVDLPFTFRYYGQDYTQIRVSDNGWVSFDTGTDYDFYNWTIPTQYGVEALVAPFWDNLNPVPPSDSEDNVNGIDPDGIYTYSDTARNAFVVEWSRLPHYKPEILGLQTFQVVLLDPGVHTTRTGDGEMIFYYRQVNNNDYLRMYATVGIESPDGTDGLQLSYGNINSPGMAPLQPGLAVRITTETPVRVPFALSRMTATITDRQLDLAWEPADDRPVLGWHVDCDRNGQRVRLTDTPLPGHCRRFNTMLGGTGPVPDQFYLTAIHPNGVTSEPGHTTAGTTGQTRLALYPAYPNPAPGTTSFGFVLPHESHVRLRVYDVAGRLVRNLVDGRVNAGEGAKVWDGRNESGLPVAGGVYFYRLETDTATLTQKMILVR